MLLSAFERSHSKRLQGARHAERVRWLSPDSEGGACHIDDRALLPGCGILRGMECIGVECFEPTTVGTGDGG